MVSQLLVPSLRRFQHQLFMATGLGGGINAYLTPAGAVGKPPHTDDHDVVVLQLWGSKLWHLGEEEVQLRAGDVMYLPQGGSRRA